MDSAPRLGPSPDRGSTLTPTRSGKSSNVGISSSEASIDGHEHEHGNFLDKLKLDKLKIGGRRGSVDERRKSSETTGRRLSRLIGSKRRNKKDDAAAAAEAEEALRGRVGTRDGDSADTLGINSPDASNGRSPQRRDSIASSLLTDDSDADASRPTLDTRTSHAGFLTLSSPLIAAETLGSTPEDAVLPDIQHTTSIPTLQPFPDHIEPSVSPKAGASPTSPILDSTIPSLDQDIIDTTAQKVRPQPVITPPPVGTPTTFITPPTPVIASPGSVGSFSARKPIAARLAQSSSGAGPPSSAVRRLKGSSAASSGLVNPLTPAIEEAKTPGGSLTQPPASSFFSSVFSATQNAVSQLSTSIDKSLGTRSRSGTASDERSGSSVPEGSSVTTNSTTTESTETTPPRQPAIATIGSGNLSLSHLGIPEVEGEEGLDTMQGSPVSKRTRASSILQTGYMPSKTEEASAAQAVSAAYVDKSPIERPAYTLPDVSSNHRPHSIASVFGSTAGDTTPPASEKNNGEDGGIFKRSGSVRSRLSDRRRRRRESSNVAGAAGLAVPSGASATEPAKAHRPAGYAVASTKRNQDFHALFRSVPEDDYLIEDYSAALQRDILLQGRLYVSEKHVCFASNILGWVTNLVIGFEEITAIEKKNTAMVFPNAVVIQSTNAKNVFASLISRDPTYDFMISIWKLTQPNLKTTEHGHEVDNNTIPPVEDEALEDSIEGSEGGSGDYYDENDDEDGSIIEADGIDTRSDIGEVAKTVSLRSPSGTVSVTAAPNATLKPDSKASAGVPDFPGPATHAPTECSDQSTHYDKLLIDTTIPAPLGKIYSMMFGPQSGVIMRKWFDDQKSTDVQYEDDKIGMDKDHKTFSYSYIKFLGAAIGPKSTKCIVTQTLDAFDLEKAVSVTCSTLTPDVPSGNVFVTKTKYCLMWGPGNSTRFIANCAIEWSGKSWIKGPIETGANGGQEKYAREIVAFFKANVAAPAPVSRSPVRNGKAKAVKGRRKRSDTEDATLVGANVDGAVGKKPETKSNWGPLEPLHDILEPLSSMVNSTTIFAALFFLMTILWIRQAYFQPHTSSGGRGIMMTPHKLAAYEEMWRREESGLWNWLEDRVGLDAIGDDVSGKESRQLLSRNDMAAKFGNEQMSDREVDEAIRVTEEKLSALKAAVEKKKGAKAKKS